MLSEFDSPVQCIVSRDPPLSPEGEEGERFITRECSCPPDDTVGTGADTVIQSGMVSGALGEDLSKAGRRIGRTQRSDPELLLVLEQSVMAGQKTSYY